MHKVPLIVILALAATPSLALAPTIGDRFRPRQECNPTTCGGAQTGEVCDAHNVRAESGKRESLFADEGRCKTYDSDDMSSGDCSNPSSDPKTATECDGTGPDGDECCFIDDDAEPISDEPNGQHIHRLDGDCGLTGGGSGGSVGGG